MRVFELGDELRLGLEPLDEVDPVRELGTDHLDRHLTPDRRLVGAVHEAVRTLAEAFAEFVSADRPAETLSFERRRRPLRAEWRELRRHPGELHLRNLDATETLVVGCADRPGRRRRGIGQHSPEQDLPAVAGRHDAVDLVHRRAEVVVAALGCRAVVDRHPNAKRTARRPGLACQPDLRSGCSAGRIAEVSEDGEHAVAGALEHMPGVLLHRLVDDPVVLRQRLLHRLGIGVPHRC